MRLLRIAIVACLAAAAPVASGSHAHADNPLPALLKQTGGKTLCFSRAYDAVHLKSHPGQRTKKSLASLEAIAAGEGASLRVRLVQEGRGSAADISASCEWSETANSDTGGGRLIPAHNRDDGFACIAVYSSNSAEEAGTVVFDLAPDGGAVTLFFEESIGLWGKPSRGPVLALGPEDRIFRLTRTRAADCRAIEEEIGAD